jgi:uncharacterized MAPEG superfamily protein
VDPFLIRSLVFAFGFIGIIILLTYQILSEEEPGEK